MKIISLVTMLTLTLLSNASLGQEIDLFPKGKDSTPKVIDLFPLSDNEMASNEDCKADPAVEELVGRFKSTITLFEITIINHFGNTSTTSVPKNDTSNGVLFIKGEKLIFSTDRVNVSLAKVSTNEPLWRFSGGKENKGISSDDYALALGCADINKLPRYKGTGTFRTGDGTQHPATMRLFIHKMGDGFSGIGVVNSEVTRPVVTLKFKLVFSISSSE